MPLLSLATDAERLRPQRTPFHFNEARKKTPFCVKLKVFTTIVMATPTTMTKFYLSSVIWKIAHKVLSLTERLLHFIKQMKKHVALKCGKKSTLKFYQWQATILQVTLPVTLLKGFSGLTVSCKTTKKDEFWGREKEIWSLILNWLKFQKGLVLQAAPACVVCV